MEGQFKSRSELGRDSRSLEQEPSEQLDFNTHSLLKRSDQTDRNGRRSSAWLDQR